MRVHLGLGSNLGDREANLRNALDALAEHPRIAVRRESSVYETEPLGPAGQGRYLNMAAEIETDLEPLELLKVAKTIETGLGREPAERWGPRLIDIDIVLWGGLRLDTSALAVPHPEFRNRRFVLEPLAEIAPHAVDPVTGKTVARLMLEITETESA